MMMKINAGIEDKRITISEWLKLLGKVFNVRHYCVVQQHGNNRNPALQCGGDLHPNKVCRIIDPALARIAASGPARPDHSYDDTRAFQRVLDLVPKIHPKGNGIEIHEDILPAKFSPQTVVEATRHGTRIFPAI